MRTLSSLLLFCSVALWQSGACAAQDERIAAPAFEVAAVKVNNTLLANDMHEIDKIAMSPTSLTMERIRLKSAIKWAWTITGYQVSGPAWLDSERYDIYAKTAGPVTEDQLRLMLRKLLADRFRLAFHRETKVMQAYELVVDKGGPKFKESGDEGDASFEPGRGMAVSAKRMSVAQFADLASGPLQAPILDKTGLKGRYDFALNLTPYAGGDHIGMEDLAGILGQAIQEQLGLKLESRKNPMEILVIEHAEKIPAEN